MLLLQWKYWKSWMLILCIFLQMLLYREIFPLNGMSSETSGEFSEKKIWDTDTDFMYINGDAPLAGIEDVADVYAYHWPEPEELYNPDLAVPLVKSLYRETDFALTCQVGGHLFEMGQFLLGFEDYLAYLYTEPEIVEAKL